MCSRQQHGIILQSWQVVRLLYDNIMKLFHGLPKLLSLCRN
jgi:hypothetical protein